jgi:hypothetical protein
VHSLSQDKKSRKSSSKSSKKKSGGPECTMLDGKKLTADEYLARAKKSLVVFFHHR